MTFNEVNQVLWIIANPTIDYNGIDCKLHHWSRCWKRKGVPTNSYGSKNKGIICGDRLCSEVPGGKDAIKNEKPTISTVPAKPSMTSPKSEKMEDKSMSI